MKLTKKFFIVLFFIANIAFSQSWIKTDVTDFVSVQFPVASELTENGRESVFSANDKSAIYVVSIRELSDQQSSQITKDDIPKLYQGFVKGSIEAAGAEIISMNETTFNEIPILELEYRTPSKPELPSQRFKRIIYINQSLISIDFWPLTEQKAATDKNKLKFFNSLSIESKKAEDVRITTGANDGNTSVESETGYLIGQFLLYIVIIALIIGLFLLMRHLLKSNKGKQPVSNPIESNGSKPTIIICGKCDTKNKADSKYCQRCGYELPKN